MSSHDEYAALLDAFLDGELSEEEAGEVRVHLSECADCQAYIADALAIRDAFPDIEETVVPDGFAESVLAALPPRPVSWRTQWAKIALPLAACAALVILLHGIADIGSGGGASMSAYTEETVTADMDAGGGIGSTAVADDADTMPPQAFELYGAAESQSARNTTTEETAPDMIPFSIRSSETEVAEEAEEESARNTTAGKTIPDTIATAGAAKEVPGENKAESVSNGSAASGATPAAKEVPDENAVAEEVPDGTAATETFPDGDGISEGIDADSVPAPEPGMKAALSGEPETPEFQENGATADLSSGDISVWTLPAEALDLFDDYTPAEKTESGIWYALTPEEFDALSRKLAKMGLEIVSGVDAPPPTARPGMEYVFVPL